MTAVGPPDCATNIFPANSAIVFQRIHSGRIEIQVSKDPVLSNPWRNLANRKIGCQKELPLSPNLPLGRRRISRALDLDYRIFEPANAGDVDLDDVLRLKGKAVRWNNARAGQQHGAVREFLAAKEEPG